MIDEKEKSGDFDQSVSKIRVLFQIRSNYVDKPGGDTQVMYSLKKELNKEGIVADISTNPLQNLDRYDIVHVFNSTTPDCTEAFAANAVNSGKLLAITPLQEDFTRYITRARLFFGIIEQYVDAGQPAGLFELLVDSLPVNCKDIFCTSPYAICNAGAVFTSGYEESKTIKKFFPKARTMEAPFGTEIIEHESDKSLFKKTYGIDDFVLCVGRLEMRKNQLMLLKALEYDPITLVFACGGVDYQPQYVSCCKRFKRNAPTYFLDRLDRNMLLSAFSSCRAHVLPSWYELPGLVTIEAAAHNSNVIASSWGTIRDYVGDEILYCEPDDVSSIRNAILTALNTPSQNRLTEKLKDATWENSAQKVIDGYKYMLENGNNKDIEKIAPFNIANSIPNMSVIEKVTSFVEQGKYKEAVALYNVISHDIRNLSEFKKLDDIMKFLQKAVQSQNV